MATAAILKIQDGGRHLENHKNRDIRNDIYIYIYIKIGQTVCCRDMAI